MKLNEQCMVDILEYCIDKIHVSANGYTYTTVKLIELPTILKQHEIMDVFYSVKKLLELKYITLDNTTDIIWDEDSKVSDVTYYGHKYLENFQ